MPEEPKGGGGTEQAGEAGPADFSQFVLMLASAALIHLGALADPTGRGIEQDPEQARRTIDILTMLQAKTAGNLSPDEAALLERLLHDLRMRYLKAIGHLKGTPP
ncbi:MAG: DUF1844 domain-containing protein [candidate division NC10 bacterium]|nr:DUF1844 domain-containing protein [candidate division NC10 bacterium]